MFKHWLSTVLNWTLNCCFYVVLKDQNSRRSCHDFKQELMLQIAWSTIRVYCFIECLPVLHYQACCLYDLTEIQRGLLNLQCLPHTVVGDPLSLMRRPQGT